MRNRSGGLGDLGTGHVWIRNNVLGLVAIFIALSGTAVAAQVSSDTGAATKAAKKKAKRGPAGPQGPQGPPGPSTGPAGGDLTGNYPNPQLGPDSVGSGEIALFAINNNDINNDAVDSPVVLNNSLTGSDITETSVNIPTAWADVSDAPLASTDPTLNASESVTAVADLGVDGQYCFDLPFTPDLVVAQDQLDEGLDIILSGEAPQAFGCSGAHTEAQVLATDASGNGQFGDIYVQFYDLQ